MKISNAARLIFWVTAIFALGFLVRAESGERRANIAEHEERATDPNFRSKRPAGCERRPIGYRHDCRCDGGAGDFAFHPDTVNISVGDTVRWTWAGSGHSVTSGPPCAADSQFCSPNDMSCFPGTLSNTRHCL